MLLYPTAHEGFGMPAAEAITCGTPVVCARVAALPEVLGDAAVWSTSLQPDDLGQALHGVLADRIGESTSNNWRSPRRRRLRRGTTPRGRHRRRVPAAWATATA